MEDYKILRELEGIEPGNEFLLYITERVSRDDYRGSQYSQHNRINRSFFSAVLGAIYEHAGEGSFVLHSGDYHGARQPAAAVFYKIVESICESQQRGTVNSVKKNTFPDFARMGVLERLSRKGELLDPTTRRVVHSARLSELGVKFVLSQNTFEQMQIFTQCIDTLMHSAISELADFFANNECGIDSVHELEYMYILSDSRAGIDFSQKRDLMQAYRRLTPIQQERVHELLHAFCSPSNRHGKTNKTLLRDYHNWKNETQQIYGLISRTAYFHVADNTLYLNEGSRDAICNDPHRTAKFLNWYLKYHNVTKREGYSLHHIVPFGRSRTQGDTLDIDSYLNGIYLSDEAHARFTSAKNKYIELRMQKSGNELLFLAPDGDFLTVDLKRDAYVSHALLPAMCDHNTRLLRKYYQYKL